MLHDDFDVWGGYWWRALVDMSEFTLLIDSKERKQSISYEYTRNL